MEWHRDEFTVSDERARLQMPAVHALLSATYWLQGASMEQIRRTVDQSSLCFGLYQGERQIGFGRIVTDFVRFAWVSDIVVAPEKQRQGLGSFLVQCMRTHPGMAAVELWLLKTRDGRALYSKYGFTDLPNPERYMAYVKPKG